MKASIFSKYYTILVLMLASIIFYAQLHQLGFLFLALFFGFVSLLSESLTEKIHWLWMKLSWLLSFVMPTLLLAIIYFFVLTPTAILLRVFSKKDLLQLQNKSGSKFTVVVKCFEREFFERPW